MITEQTLKILIGSYIKNLEFVSLIKWCTVPTPNKHTHKKHFFPE